VDESADPPFTIGRLDPNGLLAFGVFGGPVIASSKLLNPLVAPMPEPSVPAVLGLGIIFLIGFLRRRKTAPSTTI